MKTPLLGSMLLQAGWQTGDGATLQVIWCDASPQEFRKRAAEAFQHSWTHASASSLWFPKQCLRRGVGPRFGVVDQLVDQRIFWASSLSHSASAKVVATALLTQSVESVLRVSRLTIGIDIESAARVVHRGVARLIKPRDLHEADSVADGLVPLLAMICVKEAAYKADVWQMGRVLADYAWVTSKQVGKAEWIGTVAAAQEREARFEIRVAYTAGRWLAVALGKPLYSEFN